MMAPLFDPFNLKICQNFVKKKGKLESKLAIKTHINRTYKNSHDTFTTDDSLFMDYAHFLLRNRCPKLVSYAFGMFGYPTGIFGNQKMIETKVA